MNLKRKNSASGWQWKKEGGLRYLTDTRCLLDKLWTSFRRAQASLWTQHWGEQLDV